MRTNLGGIAALCVGACFVLSCAGGGGGPEDSTESTADVGAKGGATGAAGQPASGSAGQPNSGAAGQGTGGSIAPPVSGAAGQGAAGSTGEPDSGAAGSAPVSGAAGSTPPSGAAGSAPASGAAGSAPASGTAGSAPASGAAGSAPASGAAGSAPVSGAAGSTPVSGAAGQGGAGQPAGTGAGPAVGGAAGGTAPAATSAAATIVPLYTSPGDASWNAVIAAKKAHPTVGVVAIVNPNNGPGSAVSSAYASGIAQLTAAGIRVIGYVSTDYTRNSAATVKADIDRWRTFYPGQLTGIFFDEQSNQAGDVAYYRDLSQYAKAQGLAFTVGNPGTDTAEAYVGALDMMLIYETAGLPSTGQLAGWHANHAPSNFGIIPYAASLNPTFVRDARKYVQYIYVQSDNLPNPWDSVPSYFGDLLAALE